MSPPALRAVRNLKLPSTQKLVAFALADMANDYGESWPLMSTLIAITGLSERGVQTAVAALRKLGILTVATKRGTSSRYFVNVDTPASGAPTPAPPAPQPPQDVRDTPAPPAPRSTNEAKEEASPKPAGARLDLFGEDAGAPAPVLVNGKLAAFEVWWDGYPRKVGKADARIAYAKALRKTDPVTMLAALNRDWGTKKWIPYPAKWLNGERWLDEIDNRDQVLVALGLDSSDNSPLTIEHEDALP